MLCWDVLFALCCGSIASMVPSSPAIAMWMMEVPPSRKLRHCVRNRLATTEIAEIAKSCFRDLGKRGDCDSGGMGVIGMWGDETGRDSMPCRAAPCSAGMGAKYGGLVIWRCDGWGWGIRFPASLLRFWRSLWLWFRFAAGWCSLTDHLLGWLVLVAGSGWWAYHQWYNLVLVLVG